MSELRIGIAGLGTAAQMVLPYLAHVPGVRLAGGADVRAEARAGFEKNYRAPAFASVAELCRADVDAVWIETPNHLHAEHAITAAGHGKHVICAKPLAATLAGCDAMIAAAKKANVRLLVGHSKVFDPPVKKMAEIARSGRLGRVLQIDCWLYNDWLRRPRLPEELDEAKGAGFVLRQAPHMVDIAMRIAGVKPEWVRAHAGARDSALSTSGNCAALIGFAGGAAASISMNGYGYFETSELTFGIGTLGEKREPGRPRPRAKGPLTAGEKFSGGAARKSVDAMPFFGLTVVSCERGAMRQSPNGLFVYTDDGREEVPVEPYMGRAAELIELRDALKENRDVFPNGGWGRTNLQVCLGILESSRMGKDARL